MIARRVLGIRGCLGLLVAWGSSTLVAQAQDDPIVRNYSAPFTAAAPVIDGKIDGQEWAAAPQTGEFLLLRTPGDADLQNTSWRAMWDDNALYLLIQSEYNGWTYPPETPGGLDWNADNLNLYIDPNLDDEPNFVTDPEIVVPNDASDGYQIAFNMWDGASSLIGGDNAGLGGMFLEAHADSAFGNQANWAAATDGLSPDFSLSQFNSAEGGLVEIKIPWAQLNADQDNAFGLNVTDAPKNDDTWFFNVCRITSDQSNYLPTWNWTTSQSFAPRPHGELTFVGKPGGGIAGDANADGKVDLSDFGILKVNFGTGTTVAQGDFNGDSKVDLTDFGILKENFGKSGAAAVPEPATWLLAGIAAIALAVQRRAARRR